MHTLPRPSVPPPPPPVGGPYHLRTFGTVGLFTPEGDLCLGAGIPLALLTYLRAMPGRSARREHLADTFWATSDAKRSRQALRQTLTRLRVVLGAEAFEDRDAQLTLRGVLRADFDDFIAAVDTRELTRALTLYQGPFFPDYGNPGTAHFEHWVDIERERFRELFLRVADTVGRQALDHGHPREAIILGRRMQQEAPAAQAGLRLLLEGFIAAGDLEFAQAEADSARRRLAEEGRAFESATLRIVESLDREPAENTDEVKRDLVPNLVGRDREFRALIDAWRRASAGRPVHVCLTGPPGIGKSRLMTDLCLRLRSLGARIVAERGHPGEREVDEALLSDLVGSLAQLPGGKAISPETVAQLVAFNPSLASVYLRVEPPSRIAGVPAQGMALRELIQAVADEGPLAVLLDDLHWTDERSRQVLQFAAARLGGSRVLLVVAARPSLQWIDPSLCDVSIELNPLAVDDVRNLLESLGTLPAGLRWAADLPQTLHQASRGSPLLAIEAIRQAVEEGLLTREGGHWETSDALRMARHFRTSDILKHRLMKLSLEARELLLRFAVAGTPFSDEDVRVVGGTQALLVQLEHEGACHSGRGGWECVHDEICAAAIRSATPQELREAHRSVGALLSARATGFSASRRAASHLLKGGDKSAVEALAARWAREARRGGNQQRASRLVGELLAGLTSPRGIRAIARTIPLQLRWGIRRLAAAFTIPLIAAATAFGIVRSRQDLPPDAVLLIPVSLSKSDDRMALAEVRVRRRAWVGLDTIRPGALRMLSPPIRRRGQWALIPIGGIDSLVYTESLTDSGGVDLGLWVRGEGSRRLTDAPGDDLDPSPAPDGRKIVFSSGRWRGPAGQDLAILDLTESTVRRLSHSPGRDMSPQWSPDGTRVAFLRYDPSRDQARICWITVDGMIEWCSDKPLAREARILAWHGPKRILYYVWPSPDSGLVELTLSPEESYTVVDSSTLGVISGSRDGAWAMSWSSGVPTYFPTAAPRQRTTIQMDRSLEGSPPFWIGTQESDLLLARIKIMAGSAPLLMGIPTLIGDSGYTVQGAPASVDPAVKRWYSSDTTTFAILGDGWVMPRREGTAWIHLSAGGWRDDSARVVVAPIRHRVVLTEEWKDTTLSGWMPYGTPRSRVVAVDSGTSAFLPNGDETFESGAVSRFAHSGRGGVGLEAILSTPITRPVWQQLRVWLGTLLRIGANEAVDGESCGFAYSAGEGLGLMDSIEVRTGGPLGSEHTRVHFQPERPYSLEIQIFPDGTCGVAIDGSPIWRSTRALLDPTGEFSIAIGGHTVEADLVVERLTMWEGIRSPESWAAFIPGR